MRYYQLSQRGRASVAAETSDGVLTNLTSIEPRITTTLDLMNAATVSGVSIDELARAVAGRGGGDSIEVETLLAGAPASMHGPDLLPPVLAPEVWAFGVTYMDSMRERQAESGTPDVYSNVYNAERPEAFFKSTAARLQGPFDEVGIRADSAWDVPEPELAFVLYGGEIVAYTVGNDMSSRTIEGENPLYLPQAKVYDKSCSIGPCIATPETVGDAQSLDVTLSIERDGKEAFKGSSNTNQMKRDCAYLAGQ